MKILCMLGFHHWKYNEIAGFSIMTGLFYEFTDQRKCDRCSKHQWTIYPVEFGNWKDVEGEIDNSVFLEDMGLMETWE